MLSAVEIVSQIAAAMGGFFVLWFAFYVVGWYFRLFGAAAAD